MLEKHPSDARLHFGLALEHEKLGQWEDVAAQLRRYLELTEDQGNAWGRLGAALRRLERDEEAREAYRAGADAARRHHHPSMAEEFDEILEEWGD